jgi:hypothetical protein
MKNTENIFEIITNSSFAHYMTIKEWRLFVSNYQNIPAQPYKMNLSTYFDMNKDKTFYEFLRYAFFLVEAPEGFDYWFNISRRDLKHFRFVNSTCVSI